ncbi:hypothetical protein BN1051_00123 [Arthrobacter saudimassiliensis]|uniref:Uncharacterized protein n=1 Tax=Arthrobacter saudimassiliensis TaxID=1461584 RepID=A0A078MKI9_9MICC|nr:hypothetical protein BN1051_00123 [Arthrobacter saudimassiliensis]
MADIPLPAVQPELRTATVRGPEVRRLNRAGTALRRIRWAMLLLWGLLLPLLPMLLLESLLPGAVMEVVGYLLVICLLGPFGLWPVEHALERRAFRARMKVFPQVEKALAALRAGWGIEWVVGGGRGSRERLISRGTWKQKYEWALDYSGDQLTITELAPHEHDNDDDDEDGQQD